MGHSEHMHLFIFCSHLLHFKSQLVLSSARLELWRHRLGRIIGACMCVQTPKPSNHKPLSWDPGDLDSVPNCASDSQSDLEQVPVVLFFRGAVHPQLQMQPKGCWRHLAHQTSNPQSLCVSIPICKMSILIPLSVSAV